MLLNNFCGGAREGGGELQGTFRVAAPSGARNKPGDAPHSFSSVHLQQPVERIGRYYVGTPTVPQYTSGAVISTLHRSVTRQASV